MILKWNWLAKEGGDNLNGALHGVKVLDLSRYIAGPYCGLLLADMGAEVIKVEKVGGEDGRSFPPLVKDDSLYSAALNRNKRAITLNFRHPRAHEVLDRLMKWADIVIENFRPGTMEKMGYGPDRLQEINPRLIMVRSSGFGQTGPKSHRPGFDQIGQAMGGIMSMTGTEETPPLMAGVPIVDYTSGLHAAVGALSALHHRNLTGKGQVVDVSLLESAVSMLVAQIPGYFLNEKLPERRGNCDRYSAPSNAYQAKDGWIFVVAASNDSLWSNLCKLMNRVDLLEAPHFKTTASRLENGTEIDRIVQEWISNYKVDELDAMFDRAGIPSGPIRNIPQILEDDHLRARGQIVEIEHPTAGKIPISGVTIKLSETPGAIRYGPPLVGQHTEEIYMDELGFSKQELSALQQEGVC